MTHMDFIHNWNSSKNHQIRAFLRAEVQDDQLFGVEVRFCGRDFQMNEPTFETICSRIFAVAKGYVQVTSSEGDFRSGILHVAVLFLNHGYQPAHITNALSFILDEVLPGLKTHD